MNRILVTGGWGYGNLGDDAILLETLKLIKAELPAARLTVMTFDPPGTGLVLEENNVEAEVAPSIHLHLVGDAVYERFGYVEQEGWRYPLKDFMRRANSRLQPRSYLLARKAVNDPLFVPGLRNVFSKYFGDADVLVKSGGGYMNWRFMDSVVAHSCDLYLARDEGAGIMTVGQTIGPMKPGKAYYRPANELAMRALSFSDYISVRDPGSSRELSDQGIDAPVVPDLALAGGDKPLRQPAGDTLTVVLGALPRAVVPGLADRLGRTLRDAGLTSRIIVSRLWGSDIRSALFLRKALKDLGIKSDLVIPGTVGELEEYLSNSRVVISMNLHGLILAWRSGVPVVAIRPNGKIRAFMNQIGSPEELTDHQDAVTGTRLEQMVERVIELGVDDRVKNSIARDVKEGFSRGLQAALSAKRCPEETP